MKLLKTLSLLTFAIIIGIILFTQKKSNPNKRKTVSIVQPTDPNLKRLNARTRVFIDSVTSGKLKSIENPREYMANVKLSFDYLKAREQQEPPSKSPENNNFTTEKFWIKVGFSFLFSIAALFIILSKKYDEGTKKWAYSVLTLIAGVWIGTIS